MGQLIRATDWSQTALGPLPAWPASLRLASHICLHSRLPMCVWWGPQFISLYNDAYIPILGKRHPDALGKPAQDVWAEIWPEIGPQLRAVITDGGASPQERVPLVVERYGFPEIAHFTWSPSPIPSDDEAGGVGGVLCVVTEETARVTVERERDRLAEQRQLALDAARMGWWHYDPQTRIATFDHRYEEIFGVSGHQKPNDEILARIHPDDLARVWASVEAALDPRDPRPFTSEYRVRHDDGSYRWVEAHGLAAFDGDGPGRRATSFVGTVTDVTDRKRGDDQARVVLESITDAFFAVSRDWRFTYTNPQADQILGRAPGELLGRVLWDAYPGLIGSEFERVYRRVAEARAPLDLTSYYPDHDRWYEVHVYPAPDGGISVYFRDASQRQEAARVLRESEERFRALADATADAVIMHEQGRVVEVNRSAEVMFGYAPAELIGRNAIDLLVAPASRQAVLDHLAGDREEAYEATLLRKDGAAVVVEIRGREVTYKGRRVRVTSCYDVGARRAAEAAVQQTAQRLGLALAAARLGDWTWDANTDRITLSPRAGEIYDVPPGDHSTRNEMRQRLHPDDRERARLANARAIADRDDYSVEYRVPRAGGEIVWVAAKGRASYDADGNVTGMLGVVADVTDRKEAEREREQLLQAERAARAKAEEQGRLKDEFLASLSHELRTPLNAVLGWAQILRADPSDADDLNQGLAVIERNARAQAAIIDDLLDMSRIVSGKIRLDVQTVDLPAVVEAAMQTVQPAADAKGVRLQPIIDPLAGPVAGDPGRLQQVLWNLLSNSVKFSPRGTAVRIVLARVNSHVELNVIDAGEGIRPDFLPFVFDRFRQGDSTTTRRHGGLGLGLSIVKHLVELHGGTIRAHSAGEGQGATFTVTLPLAALNQRGQTAAATSVADQRRHPTGSAAPPHHRVAPPDTRHRLAGATILVVDDEPDARTLVKRLLEDCDARVITAASAAEAVDAVRQHRPDVLVSDIGMPVEDGYALLRRVRALGPAAGGDVPAVALTAYARAEDRMQAVLAGYAHHVAKPIEPAELITMVASLTGSPA